MIDWWNSIINQHPIGYACAAIVVVILCLVGAYILMQRTGRMRVGRSRSSFRYRSVTRENNPIEFRLRGYGILLVILMMAGAFVFIAGGLLGLWKGL